MLRLKAALLIRIISRQRQYTKRKNERAGLRAIILFKRHYEIASANEMHGCARAYAQIEIYWKIENTFSYCCLSHRPVQRVRCSVRLYRPRGASRDGRVHAITRADSRETRGIVSPGGFKIAAFFACAYPLSSCVEESVGNTRWEASGNAPTKPLVYWSSEPRTVTFTILFLMKTHLS